MENELDDLLNANTIDAQDEVVEEKPKAKERSQPEKAWNFDRLMRKAKSATTVEISVNILLLGIAEAIDELSDDLVGTKSKDKPAVMVLANKIRTAMPVLSKAVIENTGNK
jgi:hypothetical protein